MNFIRRMAKSNSRLPDASYMDTESTDCGASDATTYTRRAYHGNTSLKYSFCTDFQYSSLTTLPTSLISTKLARGIPLI